MLQSVVRSVYCRTIEHTFARARKIKIDLKFNRNDGRIEYTRYRVRLTLFICFFIYFFNYCNFFSFARRTCPGFDVSAGSSRTCAYLHVTCSTDVMNRGFIHAVGLPFMVEGRAGAGVRRILYFTSVAPSVIVAAASANTERTLRGRDAAPSMIRGDVWLKDKERVREKRGRENPIFFLQLFAIVDVPMHI